MTKQQKEVAQLKRELRLLTRDKRIVEVELAKANEASRYWQKQYNRLLEDMRAFRAKPETKPAEGP